MLKGAVLYAKNLKDLSQFYLSLGGQMTYVDAGEFAVISNEENEFIILQTPPEIATQIVIQDPPAVRMGTPLKPIFEVSSIEEALHIISTLGGRPLPEAKLWKFRQFLVQDIVDPEGNVIQLWQRE